MDSYSTYKEVLEGALEQLPLMPTIFAFGLNPDVKHKCLLFQYPISGERDSTYVSALFFDEAPDGNLLGSVKLFPDGNILNSTLDIICERIGFEPPFWSHKNAEKIEELSENTDIESASIVFTYNLINGLLKRESKYAALSDHRAKAPYNLTSYAHYIETKIAHSPDYKALQSNSFDIGYLEEREWNTIIPGLADRQSYSAYCLFDIVYHYLRVYAITRRKIVLKECDWCHRLFFAKTSRANFCKLDSPDEGCSEEYKREKSRYNTSNHRLYDDIRRQIEFENPDTTGLRNTNAGLKLFQSEYTFDIKDEIEDLVGDGLPFHKLMNDFLTYFQARFIEETEKRADSSVIIPIADLIEEAKQRTIYGSDANKTLREDI